MTVSFDKALDRVINYFAHEDDYKASGEPLDHIWNAMRGLIQYLVEIREKFYSERREAGLNIDPATAEIFWEFRQALDPYGIHPHPLDELLFGKGRIECFARSSESKGWVWFEDLPEATRNELWKRLERNSDADGDLPS